MITGGGRIHLNGPLWIDRWVETNVSSPVFSMITGGGRIHLNGAIMDRSVGRDQCLQSSILYDNWGWPYSPQLAIMDR